MLLTFGVLGCASDRSDRAHRHDGELREGDRSAPRSSRPVSITGAEWVLVEMGGAAAEPDDAGKRPRLRLDPGDERRVTGSTGVNHLSGTYAQSGGALQFGPLITTRRAGPPALMRQESTLLQALENTATADARGDTMELRDAAGNLLARFKAANGAR